MRNNKIKSMTIDAMFLSIMTIMTFIPSLGFISLGGPVSFTIIHIVVLIGAAFGGYKKGCLYGFMFGVLSLLKAAISPVSILDPYFINPLISVLPRAIFGLVSGILFDLVSKIKLNSIKSVLIPLISFTCTMLHSVMVLGILGLINGNEIVSEGSYWVFMGSILISSGIIESTAAAVMVFPILVGLMPESLTINNEKDNSVLLGKIGIAFSFILPFVTWFISAVGIQKAKHFNNKEGHFINKMGLIISFVIFVSFLVIYMIVS